jgi:hypothetical protein
VINETTSAQTTTYSGKGPIVIKSPKPPISVIDETTSAQTNRVRVRVMVRVKVRVSVRVSVSVAEAAVNETTTHEPIGLGLVLWLGLRLG